MEEKAEQDKQTPVLKLHELSKAYELGGGVLTVLEDISFEIESGTTCAIVGPSGSGKTTLLGLCAGLDRVSSGEVMVSGYPLEKLNEDELVALRNRHIGFVFQSFQLIPTLTALENVMVPIELRGYPYEHCRQKASSLLDAVGLPDRIQHYPSQLSGGEQQRVGIARAFIHEPDILFADEPTGNLDSETGKQVEEILFDLNSRIGTTLIIVTHNPDLADRCQRVIRLKSGKVFSDEWLNHTSRNEIRKA